MRVCYFGNYRKDIMPRNKIAIDGLKRNDVEVIECFDNTRNILSRYLKITNKHSSLNDYDVMIVGCQASFDVPLAKMLAKFKEAPLIFNAHVSIYDTNVFDRKLVSSKSLRARYYHLIDELSFKTATITLLDTNSHIEYVHEEFGIDKNRFRRIFVGADDDIFFPRKSIKSSNDFLVLFYGTFIPLHGIEYLIKAAKLLENEEHIKFIIIGHGQESRKIEYLVKKLRPGNISFIKSVDYTDLPNYIAMTNVCLGIFGNTGKAKRVIPNKAFQALAMKKPLITEDSPGAREALTNKKNAILCEAADPKAIADSIILLREDERLRKKIAERGYKSFKKRFSIEKIGKDIKKILEDIT